MEEQSNNQPSYAMRSHVQFSVESKPLIRMAFSTKTQSKHFLSDGNGKNFEPLFPKQNSEVTRTSLFYLD
jgi:hypothetical protein